MRLRLTLDHQPKQILPVNYHYLVSSWIYHTLGNADHEFATQLHQQGYDFGGKKYKLFTFSALQPRWFDLNKKEGSFILAQSPTILELSFYMDEALQHFVIGLFKDQRFCLSSGKFRADFEVRSIEVLPRPVFQNPMRFHLQTPLCISHDVEGEKYAQYLHPEADAFGKLLLQNLMRKQLATTAIPQPAHSLESDAMSVQPYNFNILTTPRSKLLTIKTTKVRGYLFDFEITAPAELLEIGFFAGFGEKNSSLGMGMGRVLNK